GAPPCEHSGRRRVCRFPADNRHIRASPPARLLRGEADFTDSPPNPAAGISRRALLNWRAINRQGKGMVARVRTVAFHGVEVIDVETQVTIVAGLPSFTVVGLPDKAVAESRERVRA